MMDPETIIENQTERPAHVKVTRLPTNLVYKKFSIPAKSSTKVTPGFCYSSSNPDRHPTISVSVDGSSSIKAFTRSHLITYGKIIVAREPNGELQISGVKARRTYLGRIKGLGCIFGGGYDGRESEIIA